MSFLQKLFGREEKPVAPRAQEELDAPCPHVTLVPHWDTNDEIGSNEKVSRFSCEGCGADFSRDEGLFRRGATATDRSRTRSGTSGGYRRRRREDGCLHLLDLQLRHYAEVVGRE